MKALILGGTRFIGLHLLRSLHNRGHQVTILNRGVTKATLPEGVARLYADRNEPSQIAAALKGASYDAVFDFSSYAPATLEPAVKALQGNVGHYVFCSSGAVFGPPNKPIHVAPIPEDHPLDRSGRDPYTTGKIQCEDLLRERFARNGFPGTMLRLTYVYGPDNQSRATEPSFFARLTQRRKVIIPGDGFTLFHPVHVDDVVSAFAAVPGRKKALGEVYNIAGPEGVTGNGFVQIIGEVMGVTPEIVYMDIGAYEALAKTMGLSADPRIYNYPLRVSRVCSIEKANRDLDWAPAYHLKNGLEMTYQSWIEQGRDKEMWDFSIEDKVLAGLGHSRRT